MLTGFLKAPYSYKGKYGQILLVYAGVLLVNFFCYVKNMPLDFSIVLYSMLAVFFYFNIVYSFPKLLLIKSLKSVNETISDGLIYFDIHGNCIYANKSAERIFPVQNTKFLKKRNSLSMFFYARKYVESRIDSASVEAYRRSWADRLGIDDEAFEIDIDTFVIDGKKYHYSVEFHKEIYNGSIIGSCLKFVDKTDEIERINKEKYSATHDELTGIYNRQGFFEAVDNCVSQNGTENYAMVCTNIKDFKLINEIFGEKIGDQVLCHQADGDKCMTLFRFHQFVIAAIEVKGLAVIA